MPTQLCLFDMAVPTHSSRSTSLFERLNTRCRGLLEEARKEVYKKALKRLSREVRHSQVGDKIIAFNVGSYMSTPESLNVLYRVVKEYDDAYRKALGERPLSYDEGWDVMGPFLYTFMHGFRDKYNLNPEIPYGQFVSLL